MEETRQIIRKSIHKCLQNYHHLTTIASLIALPFSISFLVSQSYPPSSTLQNNLKTLFQGGGFPNTSSQQQLLTFLSLKLSQTISTSIRTFPFSLTFLLISKSYTIQILNHQNQTLNSYKSLFFTYICNLLILISANAIPFSTLFLGFSVTNEYGFSSPIWVLMVSSSALVMYLVLVANAVVVGNLALVLSALEGRGGGGYGGFMVILKCCVLMRGRSSVALFLASLGNMLMAGLEALFQYRIVRAYKMEGQVNVSMVFEGILIAYLYSISLVVDTIVNLMFLKSCKRRVNIEDDGDLMRKPIKKPAGGEW